MAVIVDLNALRRLSQVEQIGDFAQQLALCGALGKAPVQCLDRIARRLIDKPLAISTLRHLQFHLAARLLGKGLGQKFAIRQDAVEQDRSCRRHILIELSEEAGEDFCFFQFAGVCGEEGAMPPILTATNEERLNAHLAGLRRQREDVSIAQPLGIDRLATLNEGQRL